MPCGSALDCPERKYEGANGEEVEYGVCVGSKLDEGKNIPETTLTKALGRLQELFVQTFGGWTKTSNTDYTSDSQVANKDLSYDSSISAPRLYSLKTAANNPKVGFTWGAQNAVTVMGLDKLPKDSGVIQAGSGSFPAVIKFFAYADNDQMPLTRMSIDWDDGPDDPATRSVIERQNVYTVKGWFKNRKPWCDTGGEHKVCRDKTVTPNKVDLNLPCVTDKDCGNDSNNFDCYTPSDNRLHFGNSSDACAQGYYQFTHLYTCKKNGPGWNSPCPDPTVSGGCCVFKPKVQVLDNWGWCNGVEANGNYKGYWNDNSTDEASKNCRTTADNPNNVWTSFAGTIEVKP